MDLTSLSFSEIGSRAAYARLSIDSLKSRKKLNEKEVNMLEEAVEICDVLKSGYTHLTKKGDENATVQECQASKLLRPFFENEEVRLIFSQAAGMYERLIRLKENDYSPETLSSEEYDDLRESFTQLSATYQSFARKKINSELRS